jgi:hypothetical protein
LYVDEAVNATRHSARVLISVAVAMGLIATLVVVAVKLVGNRIVLRESCTATAGGVEAKVSIEQAEHAATIAAVAARRGLPARAATIALATAMQESKLRNLDHGDRDSLGLFQQRPSQGWGTPAQVQDPVYAANKFYDALIKIDGYRTGDINDVAQAVQRSGHPNGYRKHEGKARALASALMGYSDAAFTCSVRPASPAKEKLGRSGLTPRAHAAMNAVEKAFGDQSVGGFAPGGVNSGHMNGSAHYTGRAVDVFYRPITKDNTRTGWATAHWLVANAERLNIATVIYDGRIWTARRSGQGWRTYTPPGGKTANPTLMHRDHVHLDVR